MTDTIKIPMIDPKKANNLYKLTFLTLFFIFLTHFFVFLTLFFIFIIHKLAFIRRKTAFDYL